MRSEEVEKAIKSCNLLLFGDIQLHIIDDYGETACEGTVDKLYNKDLETVLSYISELEEKNKIAKEHEDSFYNEGFVPRSEYVSKDVIRDKIKEIEENPNNPNQKVIASQIDASLITCLKELLGE